MEELEIGRRIETSKSYLRSARILRVLETWGILFTQVWKTRNNNDNNNNNNTFTVPADNRVKIKESENRDKYLDLARERRKFWNMRVMVILIVIGVLGTVPRDLEKGLEELEFRGQIETIQTTALLRSAIILRRVLEIWGDLLPLRLQ